MSINLSEEELKSSDWLTIKAWSNDSNGAASVWMSVGGLDYTKLLNLLDE